MKMAAAAAKGNDDAVENGQEEGNWHGTENKMERRYIDVNRNSSEKLQGRKLWKYFLGFSYNFIFN
jgi:hypothetical protein